MTNTKLIECDIATIRTTLDNEPVWDSTDKATDRILDALTSLQKERDELKSTLSVLLEKYLELACGDSYGGVEYVESKDEDAIRARKALKER